MATIHIVLQGKGGVGKSLVATCLAQFLFSSNKKPLCFDIDPINASFSSFKTLNVEHLNILDQEEINPRLFDDLIEKIALATDDVIIDSGASTFVPLSHYLLTSQIAELLKEMGHSLCIHTIIAGGQAFMDTVNGFAHLIKQFKDQSYFIVWLNSYWGAITYEGKTFEELKAYKDNAHHISSLIRLPDLKKETFGFDLESMLKERLTFSEAIESPSRNIMAKQRLKLIRDNLFSQLNTTGLI